jgi:hydroxymethylbilane synthase
MPNLQLGTRGSPLALFQANTVAGLLHSFVGVTCEIVVIRTSGDQMAEVPLADAGGKRLFVKEIEDALLDGGIDIAVHSSKDMPAVLPAGLTLGAVLPREDPRDAIVLATGSTPAASYDEAIRSRGQNPRIGTSSIRRVAQLARLVPTARFAPIRGNVDTRLRKVDDGEYDAIVLAAAGLKRLGHGARISAFLPATACVPAPGQGIIAVEIRDDDSRTRDMLRRIDDATSAAALAAEREVVIRLGGGCQMPIGAIASITGSELTLNAIVVSIDGHRAVRTEARGTVADAPGIGARAAEHLLAQGAAEILAEAGQAQVETERSRA